MRGALSHLSRSGAAGLAIALGASLLMAGCASATAKEACQKPGFIDIGSWGHLDCSAAAGDKQAALRLGEMFERGEGVRQDFVQAARYYMLAATPSASLVPVYLPPVGDARTGSVIHVRTEQAQSDLPRAQLALASLYFRGLGVGRDLKLARRWADRAAENGAPGADQLLQALADQSK